MDMQNFNSTRMYTILALIINLNEMHAKNERHRYSQYIVWFCDKARVQ